MRKHRLIYLLLAAMPFTARAQQKAVITLSNPVPVTRTDELIVFSRKMVEAKTGALKQKRFGLLRPDGSPIQVQFDDLDNDGLWDEAAFLYTLQPGQKVKIRIATTNLPKFGAVFRAHVRQRRKNADDTFGVALNRDSVPAGQPNTDFNKQKLPPFLTEGPAWENDKVGFRIYMDVRNTKDIWGKTTPAMVMDTVGANPKESYHQLSYWGMDILAVGKSLGAGSLALQLPVGGTDTLIRLGGRNMGPVIYQKVADGPVRAIFRMHYPQWQAVESQPPVSLTEEISIWGGQYFYQSKVTLNNAPANAKLVMGIVNLKSKTASQFSAGNVKALCSFDKQSENNDNLGMGIVVNNAKASFGDVRKGSSPTAIADTYTVAQPVTGLPLVYRYYAAWQKTDERFAAETGFTDLLKTELIKYEKPVAVK